MTRSHPTRSRPGRLAPAKMRQPSATEILARVLDHPDLVAAVQSLPSPVLGALVARIGLEDAGEIVALATTEQIVDTFDEDLWKQDRPGGDEAFDDARFVTWLRVLREAGDAFAARRIADLSEDFLTMALHRQMLVLDSDVLERALGDVDADEAEQVDKALTSCLREELDQYQIVSRHYDGWDDVIAVVLALDREQPDLLRRVLERCRHLTESDLEEHGGLYEVLTSEEMLASDVAGEREERRLVRGFVSPSDARAFIRLARMERHGVAAGEHDAVTRAYFRALPTSQPEPTPAVQRGDRASSSVPAAVDRAAPSLPEWLGELLARAEPETVRGRLGAGDAAQTEPLLARAMHALAARDPTAHARRVEELAYLANVWIA
ncbi:MAG: hypothetical protein IT379_36380, partial [Deltaproteobacteria bacterium]|nr:hypothetical protein [Deltaproteobacteria bacterium]